MPLMLHQGLAPGWQWYNDVDNVFRIAMPLDWQINNHLTQQQGEKWLHFCSSESSPLNRIFNITILIRLVREIPASKLARIAPDVGFDRRAYRLQHFHEWIIWIERGYHIDLQPHVLFHTFNAGSTYRSFGTPGPDPELLPLVEQQLRLAVMQRVVDSFEILRDEPDLPVS